MDAEVVSEIREATHMFQRAQSIIVNIPPPLAVLILAVSIVAVAGCKKQSDANAALDNAVKILEKSDAGQPSSPAAPSTAPGQETVSSQPVAQQMSQAMTAYKGGNYDDAVSRLHLLRTTAVKTPEQTMAVQDAMAAVMTDLYDRAAKGDVKAQQAIRQHQENRNRR